MAKDSTPKVKTSRLTTAVEFLQHPLLAATRKDGACRLQCCLRMNLRSCKILQLGLFVAMLALGLARSQDEYGGRRVRLKDFHPAQEEIELRAQAPDPNVSTLRSILCSLNSWQATARWGGLRP
jgi:hypothetical protein